MRLWPQTLLLYFLNLGPTLIRAWLAELLVFHVYVKKCSAKLGTKHRLGEGNGFPHLYIRSIKPTTEIPTEAWARGRREPTQLNCVLARIYFDHKVFLSDKSQFCRQN